LSRRSLIIKVVVLMFSTFSMRRCEPDYYDQIVVRRQQARAKGESVVDIRVSIRRSSCSQLPAQQWERAQQQKIVSACAK